MKKLMSVGVIIATAIAFAIIIVSFGQFQSNMEKKLVSSTYSRLSELSENNAASINAKIEDQLEMMQTLAAYLGNKDLYSADTFSMMAKTVESYGFLRCAITFPDGSFITHDNKNEGNTANEEYVVLGFQGRSCVTGPRPAVVDKTKTVILLTVPIYQGENIIAILTCTYETNYLENVFQMTGFEGKGYSYITDAEGKIICKPKMDQLICDGDNMMTFLKEKFPEEYVKVSENIREMKSGVVALKTPESKEYISYLPLGINDWYVFSVASGEVLDIQMNSVLKNVYSLSVGIVGTLIILGLLVWFYIYRLRKKSRKELEYLAYYDAITGLPNRNLFEKEARRILDTNSEDYAYCILNVNKFKLINDIFGFAKGDQLLRHIADIIQREAGQDEFCARFDADHFHILSHFVSKEALEKRMMTVAMKIKEFHFNKNLPHTLSVGFGVYLIEEKALPVSLMGDKARMALSKIKGVHTAATYFYNSEIIDRLMEEQEIENSMQKALDDGEMELYLQPKCLTATGAVHGAEALVRWRHSSKGIIMPDSFIPLFERNGFIVQLDMYMVEQVCRQLRQWQDQGGAIFPISVNQSRACLYQNDYIHKVQSILKKYDISPSLIEMEITERTFLDDEQAMVRIIQRLHDIGIKVDMDDFGVGYSSLNMLQDLFVDVLKIDKNFFRESINSKRGQKIVRNVVAMANDLSIEVVAEGIETEEQLRFLKDIHCVSMQGYYFSKPIPTSEFEKKYLHGLVF